MHKKIKKKFKVLGALFQLRLTDKLTRTNADDGARGKLTAGKLTLKNKS